MTSRDPNHDRLSHGNEKFQRIRTADTPSDWIALMAIAARRKCDMGDNFRSSRERYPKLASIWAYRLQRHLDLWPTDHRSVNFSSMRRLRLEASSVLPGSIDWNSPEPAPQRGSASEDQDWRWSAITEHLPGG
jgi:hypothetical protein